LHSAEDHYEKVRQRVPEEEFNLYHALSIVVAPAEIALVCFLNVQTNFQYKPFSIINKHVNKYNSTVKRRGQTKNMKNSSS
jgi:hypothetical protein